jgi:mannose-6-phosphate isomerase-like protein (cupin superfamily)
MLQRVKSPRVIAGAAVTLERAVLELLPQAGSVEVQRDPPGFVHATHTHPSDETLLIVSGSITFDCDGRQLECTSGDRLLLPEGTSHGSRAGVSGCTYVIACHSP